MARAFRQIDDRLSPATKAQLKRKVIRLTTKEAVHHVDMARHPKGEDKLWRPDRQEEKVSGDGMVNLRYKAHWKRQWLHQFLGWLGEAMPYCTVRYAF